MVFWNVAGLINKDREFWSGLMDWDVITLVETWVGERGWERIRGKLPGEYVWGIQAARKRNRKGRAIGGMVMGIKKEKLLKERTGIERDRERLLVVRIRKGTKR